jgi:hypothetical protein
MYNAGTGIATVPATGIWLLLAWFNYNNSTQNNLSEYDATWTINGVASSYFLAQDLITTQQDATDQSAFTASLTSGALVRMRLIYSNVSTGATVGSLNLIWGMQRMV